MRFHRVPFGDIWLRDTAPIFLAGPGGRAARTVRFRFNGWGGKYVLDHDAEVAGRIAAHAGAAAPSRMPFVLEGGAVDVDGEGTVLTTRQCLLNPNRNGARRRSDGRGLAARRARRRARCSGSARACSTTTPTATSTPWCASCGPASSSRWSRARADDPNRDVLRTLAARSAGARTGSRWCASRRPAASLDAEGRVMPASYVNFYVANARVVVPTYGSPCDDEAVERIGALFPGRRAVGVDARAILTGGGAFHCITQQQPRRRSA